MPAGTGRTLTVGHLGVGQKFRLTKLSRDQIHMLIFPNGLVRIPDGHCLSVNLTDAVLGLADMRTEVELVEDEEQDDTLRLKDLEYGTRFRFLARVSTDREEFTLVNPGAFVELEEGTMLVIKRSNGEFCVVNEKAWVEVLEGEVEWIP